jgi:hypothetical protein
MSRGRDRERSVHALPARRGAESLRDWRMPRLRAAGFSPALARKLADDRGVDLHAVMELTDRGCPPELAAGSWCHSRASPIAANEYVATKFLTEFSLGGTTRYRVTWSGVTPASARSPEARVSMHSSSC